LKNSWHIKSSIMPPFSGTTVSKASQGARQRSGCCQLITVAWAPLLMLNRRWPGGQEPSAPRLLLLLVCGRPRARMRLGAGGVCHVAEDVHLLVAREVVEAGVVVLVRLEARGPADGGGAALQGGGGGKEGLQSGAGRGWHLGPGRPVRAGGCAAVAGAAAGAGGSRVRAAQRSRRLVAGPSTRAGAARGSRAECCDVKEESAASPPHLALGPVVVGLGAAPEVAVVPRAAVRPAELALLGRASALAQHDLRGQGARV
jgi:hypothetical protein